MSIDHSDNITRVTPVLVHGKPMAELPQDLYIPPDALKVVLETFEGPLDLLLYLIRRQNLDILDIPITKITQQYMTYIDMMREVLRLELAAEYLLMAAVLMEIKSRLLLPAPQGDDDEEDDPRAELVRRLKVYEQFRIASENLDKLPRLERDLGTTVAYFDDTDLPQSLPDVDLRDLLLALKEVFQRVDFSSHHTIEREPLSIRERMSLLLEHLDDGKVHRFESLFFDDHSRQSIVVSLLAILELGKDQLVDILQQAPLAPIYIKIKSTH